MHQPTVVLKLNMIPPVTRFAPFMTYGPLLPFQ